VFPATRIGRVLAFALVAFSFAVPTATPGIDQGVDVAPYVAPAPAALDRFLANDGVHAAAPDALDRRPVNAADGGNSATASTSETEAVWSAGLVGIIAGASLALGVVGTALVMRGRARLG
jgi:hypothetical protein